MARRKPLFFAIGLGVVALAGLVFGAFVLIGRQKLRAEVSAAVGSSSGAIAISAAAPVASAGPVSIETSNAPEAKPSAAPPVASSAGAPRAALTEARPTVITRSPNDGVQVVPVPATSAAATSTAQKKSAGPLAPKPVTERDSKSATWKR